jgi:alpha-glucosidase
MPYGESDFSYDLNTGCDGNQASAFLVSNKGRYIWSDVPFRYTFKDKSLAIDRNEGPVFYGTSGSTLKSAYMSASKRFFPPSGTWPDSLLITAPQYNLWIELMYNPNQKDVLQYANQVLMNGWPAGVLMIDDYWFNYYGQFDFDKVKFPDPKAMIAELHRLGFKVMLWICPYITADSPHFRELNENKMLLLDNEGNADATWKNLSKPLIMPWWNGYSAHLDLTNPEAVTWLKEKLNFLQSAYGVDGFKFDAGDMNYYTQDHLASFKKASPASQCQAWNALGLSYSLNEYRATWGMGGQPLVERLRDKEHSWTDMQKIIPHTIVQQLLGYSFTCPDMIGGGEYSTFLDGHSIDQKLVVRWAQCSALMPMMQFSAAPWRVLDSVHLAAVNRVVALRRHYTSYIMEVLRNSAKTGEPALRSLEYEFPGQGYLAVNDQFMLGDKVMIAPVITPVDTRQVTIPRGKWKIGGQVVTGPSVKNYSVAIDELLIFEKVK